MSPIHIIGAGFSGMSLAVLLAEKGHRVSVYDEKPRLGGMIESLPFHGVLAETAAHSLTRTEALDRFLAGLEINPLSPRPTARRRFIYRWGEPKRWPLKFGESLRMIGGFATAKVMGKLQVKEGESLHSWGVRILGPSGSHYLLETALQGIYAGDAKVLSARLLLDQRLRGGAGKYLGITSFQGGMAEIFPAMEKKLRARGGSLHLGRRTSLQDLSGLKVIAASARGASQLLSEMEEGRKVAELLARVPSAGLITLNALFRRRGLEGFGCLVPRGENVRALGVLMNSSIFDRGWSEWSETWIYGGATDPDILLKSDQELHEQLVSDREKIFRSPEKPHAILTTRWPAGLPHYSLELEKVLSELQEPRRELERRGIYLHGNYLGGIGLSKILDLAPELIERIASHEKNRPSP